MAIMAALLLVCRPATANQLLIDPYFDTLSGGVASVPDVGTSPWFSVDEDNEWSFKRDPNQVYSSVYSLTFSQNWDSGSVVQNLAAQVNTNKMYDVSFRMLSHTPHATLTTASTIDIELFTSPTQGGTYTKQATVVLGAQNSTTNVWEQFSGKVYGASLADCQGEYLQFRITKPTAGTQYLINVDEVTLIEADAVYPPDGIIGLNVHHATTGWNLDKETMTGSETFGIPALLTETGNWNNTNAAMSNLLWGDGSGSTVGFTKSGGTYATWNGVHNDTPFRAGAVAWPAATQTLTFDNLTANFPDGYYAIVYLTGGISNSAAQVTDGSVTYYFQTPNPASSTLTEITDTNPTDGYDVGSYAVFGSSASPLTADSLTITLNGTQGDWAAIGGVQLVTATASPPSPPVPGPLPDLMLIDFDTLTGSVVVEEGSANVVDAGGNNVLELTAAPGQRVKVRLNPVSGTWNLLDYVNLTMDLENTGGDEAWVRILVKDAQSTDTFYMPNCSHNAWVQPAETRIFNAVMPRNTSRNSSQVPSYKNLFPYMNGLPHAQPLVWYGVDVMAVNEVVLQLEPQDYAQTVRIDNLRGNRRAKPVILDSNPNDFFPFIDEYFQYMHESWPGKITNDTQLVTAKADEEADLAANPRTLEYNEYGGWANGPTYTATGHFRTQKIDGKWWFIDPNGKLFWSLGCTDVGLTEVLIDVSSAKSHYYDALPDRNDPDPVIQSFYTTTGSGLPTGDYFKSFFPALYKKYGSNFEADFHVRSLERVRNWGINTLGAWSESSNNQPPGLETPYVKIIWTPGVPIPTMNKLDDPFDSNFRNAVVTAIGWTGTAKDDPYCIGFFDHNEIEWGNDAEQEARDIMEQIDSSLAVKVEMVDFLQARYGTIGAANSAWGSSYSSFNDLLPAQGSGNFNWAGAAVDMKDFYAHLADTYYSEFRAAMMSVAPDKLYLGSRIKGSTMLNEVVSAAAAHCDVVSFNIYQKDVYEFQGVIPGEGPFFPEDKPFFIGEFNFGALDRGMFWTGIEYAADQHNRGEAYILYIQSGLEDPRCVGAHWFSYTDGALAGRPKDSENAAKGLVDGRDMPYESMVGAIREVSATMYGYRNSLGASNTAPSFTSDPVVEMNATENAAYSSTLADDASDPDSDPLIFSAIGGPAWLNVAANGDLSGTPDAAYLGLNSWMVQVSDGNGGTDTATLEITVDPAGPAGPTDDFANADIIGNGTVSGSYLATQVSDNSYQAITEIESGGKPSNRHSLLDHRWTINVTGGNSVIFHVEAHHSANSEGDDFVFAYSTDNVSFTDMVTVIKTADDDTTQSYAMPASLSGTVYIRVVDTDQSQGNKGLDTVYVDEMYIRSDGEAPPNQPPAFSSDPVVEINATENTSYSATLADDAADPENDPMTFSKISGPAWLNVATDGTLSGMPGSGDVGLNTFSVQVDAAGGSDTATLEITVDADTGGPLPGQASNPDPAHGARNISVTTSLSWTAGSDAVSHDVYFGTQSGNLTFMGNQTGTTYNPGTLSNKQTYYWRIDEVNASGTTTGTQWKFTTVR
jgi:hypothetical protein